MTDRPRLAFLFSSQGTQYPGMGRDLFETSPVYREAIERCDRAVGGRLGPSLVELLYGEADSETLMRVEHAEPVVFAFQYALVRLLDAWGVRPDLVLGHSVGELAAACAAGVFSPEAGLEIALSHGRALAELPDRGRMAVARCGEDRVASHLEDAPGVVVIAAVNSPNSVTFSGEAAAVHHVAAALAAEGIETRPLQLGAAYHSPLVEPTIAAMLPVVDALELRAPGVPLVSYLTGDLESERLISPDYWACHLRPPVRFERAICTVWRCGVDAFVEIGPSPLLLPMVDSTLGSDAPALVATHRPGRAGLAGLLEGLGDVFRGRQAPPADAERPTPAHTGPSRRALEDEVRSALAEVLRIEDPQSILADRGFFDQGLSSLGAVRLVSRLEAALGQSLPVTIAFDHPSLDQLVEHLDARRSSRHSRLRVGSRQRTAEPIAIVGMACRFPGGVRGPEELWTLLSEGVDTVREVPPERWNIDEWYDPDPDAPGKMVAREAAFLDEIDRFDAGFFGISANEARAMDPQHRMLLELSWEALERSGHAPDRLRHARAGVFVGIASRDYYDEVVVGSAEPADIDVWSGIGSGGAFSAGRIAYALGLQGPAVPIDTLCSSSLVALHLACRALENRECDLALAGGASLILSPVTSVFLSRARAMSPRGRCRTFDAGADGYGRGEGCGVVVLQRLSDAERDGHPILAVIRGSAVNHDGPSSGITAPNGEAQVSLLGEALAHAGLAPDDVGYVEAHGTGTPLGDPIEVHALCEAFGPGRTPARPLVLGSIKPNIGHLEAGAGIAGLIKVVLALQHEEIPRQLNFERLNPHISVGDVPVEIPVEPHPWPASDRPRVAGVSSFGLSGTNAHVLVAEAPPRASVPEGTPSVQVLKLAARDDVALCTLAGRTAEALEELDAEDLADFCALSNRGHADLAHRAAVVGEDPKVLSDVLRELSEGRPVPAVHRGEVRPPAVGVALFCPGAADAPACRSLYETEPIYREVLDRCDTVMREEVGVPLAELLFVGSDRPARVWPALVAVEVALARLWLSWGVEPAAVLGHGVGELAAAGAAGVLSPQDAVRLAAVRGRLVEGLVPGAMVAVLAPRGEVEEVCGAGVEIAAVNALDAVVLSGEPDAVADAAGILADRGRAACELPGDRALHSALVEPALEAWREALQAIDSWSEPEIPMFSTLTGALAEASVATPEHWVRQLREPVRLGAAAEALVASGCRIALHVGPSSRGLAMLGRAVPEAPLTLVPSLRSDRDDRRALLEALAALYTRGVAVDWRAVHGRRPLRPLPVPTTPFREERHWLERPARRSAAIEQDMHPLLGRRLQSPVLRERVFEAAFQHRAPSFLGDHRLFGEVLVPAACYVSMALAAHEVDTGESGCTLGDLVFARALALRDDEARRIQLVLDPEDGRLQALSLGEGDAHELHASGQIATSPHPGAPLDLESIRARCTEAVSGDDFYADLWDRGYHLGTAFRWIRAIQRAPGEALGRFEAPVLPPGEARLAPLHPALVDACFQLQSQCFFGADGPQAPGRDRLFVPFAIERFTVHRASQGPLWCHARARAESGPDGTVTTDIALVDDAGAPVAEIVGCTSRAASRKALLRALDHRRTDWLYELDWRDSPTPDATPDAGGRYWLVVQDEGDTADALCEQLRLRGDEVLRLAPDEVLASPDGWEPLLDGDYDGVITLQPLNAPDPTGDAPLAADVRLALEPTVHLVQGMARRGARRPLWIVTRGAVATSEGEPMGVLQTTLVGLHRVVTLEHPELSCRLLDLPVEGGIPELAAELGTETLDNVVAFREGERRVPVLVRLRPAATGSAANWRLRSDASYLVTGGFGGLGLVVARWMAEFGARHLVLMGRSEPSSEAEAVLTELAEQDVQVRRAFCSVADADGLEALLEELREEGLPLAGVVHAAGVVDDSVLLRQDWARFERAFEPKVDGGWNLHRLTQDQPLDFFVLFSSVASVLGSSGQANYSAANAFLDGLAMYRRSRDLPALSIGWGAWSEVGMAERARENSSLDLVAGMGRIAPGEGVELLHAMLEAGTSCPPHVVVLPIEWQEFLAGNPTVGPAYASLLSEMLRTRAATRRAAGEALSTEGGRVRAAFMAEEDGAVRRALLKDWLVEQLSEVLHRPVDLHGAPTLGAIGIDSMAVLELRTRIWDDLRVRVPMNLFLQDDREVGTLAEAMLDLLDSDLPAEPSGDRADSAESEDQPEVARVRAPDQEARSEVVYTIFRGTGAIYDELVDLSTNGEDARWKARMMEYFDGPRRVLDLACGTGILTYMLRDRWPECEVVGVDLQEEYLAIARRRAAERGDRRVTFLHGPAEEVDPPGTFDLITTSYLPKYCDLRLVVPRLAKRLEPGGQMVMHDFTWPEPGEVRDQWEKTFERLLVYARERLPEAEPMFRELPPVIRESRWVDELMELMRAEGFEDVRVERLSMGTAAIVSARRPVAGES